ncbi:hypothetical protein KL86DES1_21450 [uncultured Desulfovibrio sp.]|uniref:Uncharacterized protein n=1 Tax=uncultured Desulfovibrio sp. TaxID=167968 RepID=A0A212L8K7_9BACT|nr:hypothetical protein KL86DES1_21450 [uncultured Desulfovibrio sp.]VZH34347.1 conserved protein of unknown function [Desulfovibrio sp. 86]
MAFILRYAGLTVFCGGLTPALFGIVLKHMAVPCQSAWRAVLTGNEAVFRMQHTRKMVSSA